ncbi:MAG: TatD family hydrolase [Acidobacteriota bacterium]
MLFDTHAHLCSPRFAQDLDAVLHRAQSHGVAAIVAVSETAEDAEATLDLATRHAAVRPAVGLYPTVLDFEQADRLETLLRQRRDEIFAVGEIGLDHWKVKEPDELELQERLFRRFVRLAKELDLPVNVHSRSAGRRTLEVLLEEQAPRVQMHAFDGRAAKARPGVEAGYFFSVPPSIVRSRQKEKLVRQLPTECLLLETDSPVLGAVADQRNEPSEVTVALEAICRLRALKADEAEAVFAENTLRLYGERLMPREGEEMEA